MGQRTPTPRRASTSATQSVLPFTFFFTHYVFSGTDPMNPTGVRYESTGHPFADSATGDRITMSGDGAWDPAASKATGGGDYVITDPGGQVKMEGTWRVHKFLSFIQIPGWWAGGLVEDGWQGPPGSVSFAGFLRVQIDLDHGRSGVLTAWCVMSEPYRGHVSDGISVQGKGLDFTDSTQNEMGPEGVMFYGPGSS